MEFSQSELDGLKYRELQKLAKDHGIRANLPRAQLVEELLSAGGKGESEGTATAALNLTFDKDTKEEEEKPEAIEARRSTVVASAAARQSSPTTPKVREEAVVARDSGRFAEFVADVGKAKSPRKSVGIKTPVTSKDVLRARFVGTPASVSKRRRTEAKTPRMSTVKKTLEKKVQAETQIPRFVSKRVPNFAKMHAQEFDKMDSLDVYLSKKKERTQSIKKKFVESKKIASELVVAMTKVKKMAAQEDMQKKSAVRRSPRNFENRQQSQQVFVPSSLTVNERNFQFGGAKTPGSCKPFTFTASPRMSNVSKTSSKPFAFMASPRVSNVHPAILSNITNAATATPGSAKKTFNLKESLAKPLTYQPHKGKLKTWEEKKKLERQALSSKTIGAATEMKNKIKGVRLNKRAELLLQRRNKL